MNQRQALSPKFNLSLGFLPGAIAVFAGFFIQPETALYTGAGIGLALSLICWQIRPLLLYGTTGALLALVFFPIPQEESWFPLLVESVVFAPTLLLLLFGRKWIDAIDRQRHRLIQSIEAAIVSARILFILVLLHGVFALILSLFAPDTSWRHALLCRDVPFGILLTPILLNQIGLYYFNKRLKRIRFIPVVNTQGVIIGKKPLLSAVLQSDNTSVYPIVRIAITAYNMLHLSPRPQDSFAEQGKTDLSLEDYLLFGESVKQAARIFLLTFYGPVQIVYNRQQPLDNLQFALHKSVGVNRGVPPPIIIEIRLNPLGKINIIFRLILLGFFSRLLSCFF